MNTPKKLSCIQLKELDIPDLIELEQSYTTSPWNCKQFSHALSQDTFHALGIQTPSQQILGYISFYHIQTDMEIITLVVQKDMRRQGLGKFLLYTALQQAIHQGIVHVTLEVNETNIPAIALYKNFGFTKTGMRTNYYKNKENAYIYTRDLLLPLPQNY